MTRLSVAFVLLLASATVAAGCAKNQTSPVPACFGDSVGLPECQGMGAKKPMQGMMTDGPMRGADAGAGTMDMACVGMAPDGGHATMPAGGTMGGMGAHGGAPHNCPMGTGVR